MSKPWSNSSSRNRAAETQQRILLEGFYTYFRYPERDPGRNETCEAFTRVLAAIDPTWTCRQVRLHFNTFKHFLADRIPTRDTEPILTHPSAVSVPPAEVNSLYTNAMIPSAFERLMSDAAVALSVINSVLGRTISTFRRMVTLTPIDPDVLMGARENATMDFVCETEDGENVIVEVQARCEGRFDVNALLSGSPPFADAVFSVDPSADRSLGVREVYVIRFVDYVTAQARRAAPGDHIRVRDEFPETRPDGIHMIEIELPRIKVNFPVVDEVASAWDCLAWWYYLLKFSDRFEEVEIGRCGRLGMPAVVMSGLKQLDRSWWPDDSDRQYLTESRELAEDREALERRELRDFQMGQLLPIISRFLRTRVMEQKHVEWMRGPFRPELVEEVWVEHFHKDSRATRQLYAVFIAGLKRHHMLTD
jgi:hypothetical protein